MSKRSKNTKIQLVIITCCLIGSAHCVSLFGVDLGAPSKIVKTGIGQISQALKPVSPQIPTITFGGNKVSINNANDNQNGTTNAGPLGLFDKIKLQQPSNNNQLIQDTLSTRKPIKVDPDSEKVPGSLAVKPNQTSLNQDFNGDTLGWSENGPEYTTETDYETTTEDESPNRIGGPPPAVLASLLGSG